jgi:4-hydroxy-3-polyprenylbenzoate decarboxylase
VLDHATSEIAIGNKLGIDATKKLLGAGFKRPWPALTRLRGFDPLDNFFHRASR